MKYILEIKRIVGCGVGRLSVREECVWGDYCAGEGKGEEREGVRLMGGCVICFAERYSVKRVYFS
jgi:hypothetical protein